MKTKTTILLVLLLPCLFLVGCCSETAGIKKDPTEFGLLGGKHELIKIKYSGLVPYAEIFFLWEPIRSSDQNAKLTIHWWSPEPGEKKIVVTTLPVGKIHLKIVKGIEKPTVEFIFDISCLYCPMERCAYTFLVESPALQYAEVTMSPETLAKEIFLQGPYRPTVIQFLD